MPWLRSGDHGCTCGFQSLCDPRDPLCAQHPHHEGCTMEEVVVWPSATPGLHPDCEQGFTCFDEKHDSLHDVAGTRTVSSYRVLPSFYWLCFLTAGSLLSEAVISQETSIFQCTGRTWLNEQDSPAWQEGVSLGCCTVRLCGAPALPCGVHSLHPSQLGTPVDLQWDHVS